MSKKIKKEHEMSLMAVVAIMAIVFLFTYFLVQFTFPSKKDLPVEYQVGECFVLPDGHYFITDAYNALGVFYLKGIDGVSSKLTRKWLDAAEKDENCVAFKEVKLHMRLNDIESRISELAGKK
jgi:hypothetical protein